MGERKRLSAKLEKFKYPLLILAIGLLILLMPSGASAKTESPGEEQRMQELLCSTEGIGRAMVLISDKGVVVTCEGAENPLVRLDIIRAIGSYTGFGSDKITIMNMAESR